MAVKSSNEGKVVPTLVGTRVENAAKGSGRMSEGKRAASQLPTKPRISANFDGR